jgi:iron complex transport system ATP-binding protein
VSRPLDQFDTAITGVVVTVDERAVRVCSERPLRVLSSALTGGGLGHTHDIVNMHVDDVAPDSSPQAELAACAAALGVGDGFVGLMTAAATQHARLTVAGDDDLTVASVVSVGLSNTTRAGLTPPAAPVPGTINAIVLVDGRLTDAALVNAVITATEAKTAVLAEWDVRTPGGELATGTSTDAVVVACTGRGDPLPYAGPATPVGHLVARTVRDAIGHVCRDKVARDGGRVGW